MQFRLVTYNIHKCIGGVDRKYGVERVIETLSHYAPDIALLQEVDDGVPRSRHHRQIDVIGDGLGLNHRAFQGNVSLRIGQYGNAILSRFPLSDIRDIELTVPLKKRRRAIAARCTLRTEHHSRTLLVINMHLGLAGFERTIQLRRILACDLLKHIHPSTGVIAAGDFNDVWGKLGKRLLEPIGFIPASGPLKTFPAFRPIRALDRVYFRGELKLLNCFASRSSIARKASDHLPIVTDFEIPIEP